MLLYVAISCSEASETFVYNLVHTTEQSYSLAVKCSEASETFLYNLVHGT